MGTFTLQIIYLLHAEFYDLCHAYCLGATLTFFSNYPFTITIHMAIISNSGVSDVSPNFLFLVCIFDVFFRLFAFFLYINIINYYPTQDPCFRTTWYPTP